MRRGLTAALALLALVACRAGPTSAADKPEVHVLTSLPLLFEEGFGLESAKSEAAIFLREHYHLKPIDLPSQLPKGGLLLAAQPRALPAEELVALDAWVRSGGKLLLLADPLLEWPSERALGDRLRPPVSFADTGLLLHWGLRLDAPDKRGLKPFRTAHAQVEFVSPGRLKKVSGPCLIDVYDDIVAECKIGAGGVLVIADADWLDDETVENAGGDPDNNLSLLLVALVSVGSAK